MFVTPDLDDAPADAAVLDDALVAALDGVVPRYGRVLRRALAEAEGDDRLSPPQLRCLRAMTKASGPALTTRLARDLLVTPPTMTRTVDGLVALGLVERRPDPANRRQVALVITPAGAEALARHERIMRARMRRLLAGLDAPAKRRLLAALGDLAAAVEADKQAANREVAR